MISLDPDPRLVWEPSHTRPQKGATDPFVNQMERDFAAFLNANNIKWEYEPHFYYIEGSTLKHGYCPDFYLEEYGVYIEIYDGKLSEGRRQKRLRILLLSRYSAKATVMVHKGNFDPETADWTDMEYLIYRAKIPALVSRTAQVLEPRSSAWES